jgi:transposase/uncharacterized protein (UPF0179 family)
MMGHQPTPQPKLFYERIQLDQRIRSDHVLRRIARHVDFDFIYQEVQDSYGPNGNVSVPPPVILKLMMLLILYNVRSERELMATLPERLDWLWFLGFDLDDEIPNHSVLSKARTRWGTEAFKQFFQRIVWQCVEGGLVDGRKLFMDSCLVRANASNTSVVKTGRLKAHLDRGFRQLQQRLDEPEQADAVNRTHVSTTDPDASSVRRGAGQAKLQYQVHRAVDERCEIITATEVSTGSVHEAHRMESLLDGHANNTGTAAKVCVADSKYGTTENYLGCHDRGIKSHFASLEQTQRGRGRQAGILPKEAFTYEASTDSFICPAGQRLTRRRLNAKRQQWEYTATAQVCSRCTLQPQCTRSRSGRSLQRHVRQEALDRMRSQAQSLQGCADRRQRQHLMERSFARGTRYGIKRARWRRLWRVAIQEYLTAAIQNIMVFVKHFSKPLKAVPTRVGPAASSSPPMRIPDTCFVNRGRALFQGAVLHDLCNLLSLRSCFEQQPLDS